MHHRLDSILDALRQDVAAQLHADPIHEAARKAGHRWRACTFRPAAVVRWFVVRGLHAHSLWTVENATAWWVGGSGRKRQPGCRTPK